MTTTTSVANNDATVSVDKDGNVIVKGGKVVIRKNGEVVVNAGRTTENEQVAAAARQMLLG
jgi:hypothetical protein